MSKDVVVDIGVEPNGRAQALYPEARVKSAKTPEDGPSRTDYPRDPDSSGKGWSVWGKNDRFPTDLRCKLEKVPLAGSAISKLTAMMYGNGLYYVNTKDLHDQDTEITPTYNPAVEEFRRKNRLHKWILAQIQDYRYYMNAFSEMVFNKGKNRIERLYHKQAEFCRLEKQNESTLEIERLYYSPYFADENTHKPKDDQIAMIPLFNWEREEEWLKNHRGHSMAYHSHFPTPGVKYYARPPWIGLFREKGWLDVSAKVPEIIHSMQTNQMAIKYQVIIPHKYFQNRHEGWEDMTMDDREEIIEKKIDQINDYLTGTDNVYKSLCQVVETDPMYEDSRGDAVALDRIRIEAVDDKVKKGAWIPDSQAADSQIVQGLGIHPSQMGLQPEGGKMGGGSGSDQRESYNTQITLNNAHQHIILEPLNYISEFNNWGVTFMLANNRHVTLDEDKTGVDPSPQNPGTV